MDLTVANRIIFSLLNGSNAGRYDTATPTSAYSIGSGKPNGFHKVTVVASPEIKSGTGFWGPIVLVLVPNTRALPSEVITFMAHETLIDLTESKLSFRTINGVANGFEGSITTDGVMESLGEKA